jgi:hypothetical protein
MAIPLIEPVISIQPDTLSKISLNLPQNLWSLLGARWDSLDDPQTLQARRHHFPLFEELIMFLYSRWLSLLAEWTQVRLIDAPYFLIYRWLTTAVPRTEIFGQNLSREQKTSLGEAIDRVLHLNLLPSSVNGGIQLSFLSLCYHGRFGFRDDPILLQRMWYIRAYTLLLDSPDTPREGERWKWYDHKLTMVIYSWVRHNRKYHVRSIYLSGQPFLMRFYFWI